MTTNAVQASEAIPTKQPLGVLPLVTEIGTIVLISALVALAFNVFAVPLLNQQKAPSKIAFVNYEQLVGEYVLLVGQDVVAGKLPVSDVTVKSNQFTQEILKRLQAHAEAGTTVLRTESVVAAPAGVPDLTDTLRNELVAEGYLRKEGTNPSPAPAR
ncbi:type-F conjugative transfer system protein TrbI [Acidovorax sp. LjRoot129]|uniref:TrbI F-type domain-containing protein n=1 Tax=unclassified Acidovorax TaxID=2684926 RepID=UPI003ECEA370